jgi:hypothetical protein
MFPKYRNTQHHWKLIDGMGAIAEWLKTSKIEVKLSHAGRATQQIIKTLGGFGGVRRIASAGVVKLLNEMSRKPIAKTMKQQEFIGRVNDAVKGDVWREGAAENLVKGTSRAAGVHPHLSESHLASTTSLGLMLPTTSDESLDQDSNNIADLVDLISVLAYVVRLEIRQPGILKESSGKLLQTMQTDQRHLESVLGFVLYIGLDLFIFYLILWEFVMQRDLDRGR